MKYVVAVSGGVDSMVLLDMMSRIGGHDIVVAHFDHGIRSDSADDADFVRQVAMQYDFPFETQRVELGAAASEESARIHRYTFLHEVAGRHDARLVTAHHADDVIESIAINVSRGTGWRGVAVMDAPIDRPLLSTSKQSILQYARERNVSWREDSTNASDAYLRNRLRRKLAALPVEHKRALGELHQQQKVLKTKIHEEIAALVGEGPEYGRYFFLTIPKPVALECLRYVTEGRLTRPQCERLLVAIKTAAAGAVYEAGSGVRTRFTTRNFSL